jgi:septal ring factor EnvC (AmiA/AmiB activator)
MTDPSAIDAATRRLTQALDALQAAVARKREAETGGDAITMQLQALGNDRARLAADLDTAAARIRQLEDTNREVSRRIDVAMSTIEKLLDEHDR